MRICLLVPFLFSFYIKGSSQNILAAADSLYTSKNYSASAQLYLKAASRQDFKMSKAGSYYNAACCFALESKKDSAFTYLWTAKDLGWNNKYHLLTDKDLESLHNEHEWKKLVKSMKEVQGWTNDPTKPKLVTTDIKNFWTAYDMAQKDTANRLSIYREYYINPGTPGLQDYFTSKVGNMKSFLKGHDRRSKFYASIRQNSLNIENYRPQMMQSFARFKELYPGAKFPDIYFIIGNFTSGGTVSSNGILLGSDQLVKTAEVDTDELNLWERNVFAQLENITHIVAHELIHYNQFNLSMDTTLLAHAIREGMADFFAELISGKTSNERLFVWVKGKEMQVWEEFKKEMWLDRSYNWIGNATQETAERPADLGYWIGYMICKAYYDHAPDKKQALYDLLNIKNMKGFYETSRADEWMAEQFQKM